MGLCGQMYRFIYTRKGRLSLPYELTGLHCQKYKPSMLQESRLCIYSYLLFPRLVAVKSSEPSMQAAGLAENPIFVTLEIIFL